MTQRTIRHIIEGQEPVTATAAMTVGETARLMRQHKVGAVMVVENDKLVGVFTERDAAFRVVAEERDGRATKLGDVMTRNPQTLSPDQPFLHALEMMYRGGFRHVPVVDNGRPVGMVSARDALGPDLAQFKSDLIDREHIGEIL